MTQSIAALKSQAKLSYRYWHLYLEYRRRMIVQRLGDAHNLSHPQNLGADELTLLQANGFPNLSQVASISFKAATVGQVEKIFFCMQQDADDEQIWLLLCVRLLPGGQQEAAEILAIAATDAWYLERATQAFNRCLSTKDADSTYNAARFWAALHGSVARSFEQVDKPLEEPSLLQHTVHQEIEEEIENMNEDFIVDTVSVTWEDWG